MFKLISSVLLISAAQASLAASVEVSNLPGVFAATCLDGAARLSARDVTKINFGDLPESLRNKLDGPNSGDVWRLNTGGRSYLYVLNYVEGPGVSPKICGLASDEMSLDTAADLLDLRLAGGTTPERARATQWIQAEDGYVAVATRTGSFNVVQVNWLSDKEKAAALAAKRSTGQ